MKIITNKHTTTVYLEKKHGKLLRATLKKIKGLKYIDVVFVKNRFIVKYVLNEYHKTRIANAFKNIISGHISFVWL